jgi:hypothetical protein
MLFISSQSSTDDKPRTLDLLYGSVFDALTRLRGLLRLQHLDILFPCIYQIFPGISDGWTALPAFAATLSSVDGGSGANTQPFASAYLGCLHARFHPRLEDRYFVTFVIPREDWAEMRHHYDLPRLQATWRRRLGRPPEAMLEQHLAPWEWRIRRSDAWTAITEGIPPPKLPLRGIKKPRAVELRAPIEHIKLSVRRLAHPLLEDIRALQTALSASINEVVTLIKDGPVVEHRFVGCHGCEDAGKKHSEESPANGFKLDGSTFRVTIF